MLSLEEFVERQEICLKTEREEEIRAGSNFEHGNFKALEKRGSALVNLIFEGSRTGLYGRRILSFGSKRVPPLLPSHSMSNGDIVKLISKSKSGEESPSGVVTFANTTTISVSLDEESNFDIEDEKETVTMVKVANDVTYKRLQGALAHMSPPNASHSPKILNSKGELDYFNQSLNPCQRSAVEFALLQKEIGIIHGPPGTGKTTTVVEIVSQAVKSGCKVLCVAPSNVAVDNLLERLVKNKLKCVRIGHPARISADLQKYSLDALIDSSDQTQIVRDVRKDIDLALKNARKNRNEIKELRRECREREGKAIKEIFFSSSSHINDTRFLGLCLWSFKMVIDECSQALELSCWISLPQAPKAILSGDHCQLPPTVMSQEAISKGFANTLMERLVKSHPVAVRVLEIQYRMNNSIMNWSSKEFYESKLKAGSDEVGKRVLIDLPGIENNEETSVPIILIDTAGCDMHEFVADGDEENGSKGNEGEASLVVSHVRKLIDAGMNPSDIAVITPYNLQVELIRSQFSGDKRPEVRSVDGFQGQEKEASPPRLNVAVTRAKRHLAVVCDSETLSKGDPFLKRFVEYLGEHGEIRSAMEYSVQDLVRPAEKIPKITSASISSKKSSNTSKEKKSKVKSSKKQDFHDSTSKKKEPLSYKSLEEGSSEDPRCNEYRNIVKEFLKSKSDAEFPSLSHESIGEGKDRKIVIKYKKQIVEEIVNPPNKGRNTVGDVKTSDKKSKKGNIFEALPDEATCRKSKAEEAQKSSDKKHSLLPSNPKPSVKKNKLPEGDDFDELCNAFAKMDAICNALNCKTKVATLGMNCPFCRKRFCLSHGMAEIHGCGDEARKSARKQIVREGKIYPGSGKPDRSMDKVKRSQLSKKLNKTINEKSEDRKNEEKRE
ncbi:IGHMBP2 [Lepeophtheirus salmonis]|uniref:DNA helicase n=1 Tax=Lepeophtheirus salmonis TaxID=72036 RepID=A0A7R8CJP6_LEPSM|nr:IGHMBP2 [Lepeophtheirus salmonis]CAF2838272.1 IGHMBP2 [Lepeophtheirus salmonis]